MSSQSSGASSEAIQSHYDVSTDFYKLWLDENLIYSCALWGEGDSLDEAQINKLNYHADNVNAYDCERILDIGCGWGGLMFHLVDEYRVKKVTGLTLSNDQARHILSKNNDRCGVHIKSWEEYDSDTVFDSIVSVGAFEHFVRTGLTSEQKVQRYKLFFTKCRKLLKEKGLISLQTICYENSSASDFSSFFETEIFPESDLPRLWEILYAADRQFEVIHIRMDRDEYFRTLQVWRRNLETSWNDAVDIVGEDVCNKYNQYLKLVMIGFKTGTMNLARVALRRL